MPSFSEISPSLEQALSTSDTVTQMLERSEEVNANRTALIDGYSKFTYRELLDAGANFGRLLHGRGIRPGDRVAIALPNCWQYVVCYLGIHAVGAIAVLVNIRFTADEIHHVLEDSGAVLAITNQDLAETIPSETVVIMDTEIVERPAIGHGRFESALRGAADPAHLLYTSGTTGKPKGAIQTHKNLVYNAGLNRRLFQLSPDDRTLIAAPFFHATGMNSQLLGLLSAGGTCVTQPAFTKAETLGLLERYEITYFAGVATMLQLLTMNPDFSETDLSRLRLFVLGGAPVPESIIALATEEFPQTTLGNVWGQTEATSIATFVSGEEYIAHPDSVGRAVDGVEVRVFDNLASRFSDDPNFAGELCVRGPIVTAGYWDRPEATAQTFRKGWLHTGDIGTVDSEGYVRVLDRQKDMIIRGGENVYSLEVENVLSSHPDVAMAAVFGRSDDLFGERVCAAIVAKNANVTVDRVREYAQGRLADFKLPVEWHLVTELPTNASGKILKRTLPEFLGLS